MRESCEFPLVMVMLPVAALSALLLIAAVTSMMVHGNNKTPSLGECTLEGHIMRCHKVLGVKPYSYIDHEYEVLEIAK